MAYSYLLKGQLRESDLSPCYVLYGEEAYLADQFIRQLREVLSSADGEPLRVERFDLEEARWAEILDVAKTASLFFAPWRILVVTAAEDSKRKPSAAEEKMIRGYCQSPPQKTVLIVILSGQVRKGHPVLKTFESLPPAAAVLLELRPLKGRGLSDWVDASLRPSGKVVTSEAKEKLIEIVGNDLGSLDNEIEKLLTFAADRRVIDVDDVIEVCDWGRTFEEWDLVNGLEKADARQSVLVLDRLFREGPKPEYILGAIASLFRDLLLARLWLSEGREKKEIFRSLRPRIQENWSSFPSRLAEFFYLVESFTDEDLNRLTGELERIDALIKTSDAPAEAMIAGFVIECCRVRRRTESRTETTSGKRS